MPVSNASQVDTKLNFLKDRMKKIVDISLERVVAHNENPQYYPLPASSKSLERALHTMFKALPNRDQRKLIDKVAKTLKAGATARKSIYGDLAEVNFRSSASLVDQVKTKPIPSNLKFTEADMSEIRSRLKLTPTNRQKPPVPAQAVEATEMSFVVNSIKCIKTTDVIKDELSLAGFANDNLGNGLEVAPFFVGKFKKGETLPLANGRLFSFKLTEGQFPKTFVAGAFLVEKDLLTNSDFVNGLITFCIVAPAALSAITLGMLVVAAAGGPFSIPLIIGTLVAEMILGIAGSVMRRMLDDISFGAADALTLDAPVAPGTTFDRTFSFELGDTGQGRYEAAVTWITA